MLKEIISKMAKKALKSGVKVLVKRFLNSVFARNVVLQCFMLQIIKIL